MSEPYTVDDRGNVVQFYEVLPEGDGYEMVAELDREYGDDCSIAWDGDPDVTAWAAENGYPEVLTCQRIQ